MTATDLPADNCPSGKRAYPTELAARRELRAVRKTRRAAAPAHETRAYLCPLCGGWHLTSKRNEFARPARARPPRPRAASPATLAALARVAAASTTPPANLDRKGAA